MSITGKVKRSRLPLNAIEWLKLRWINLGVGNNDGINWRKKKHHQYHNKCSFTDDLPAMNK